MHSAPLSDAIRLCRYRKRFTPHNFGKILCPFLRFVRHFKSIDKDCKKMSFSDNSLSLITIHFPSTFTAPKPKSIVFLQTLNSSYSSTSQILRFQISFLLLNRSMVCKIKCLPFRAKD